MSTPPYDAVVVEKQEEADMIDLGDNVKDKLTKPIRRIGSMYRDNPFHNFEHASHVTMSVVKQLS